jgi:predicted acylesterase/phospholipase RssA
MAASAASGTSASGRDVALVLSGGGVNGVLMELGFLKRVRESALWPRVGWVFGTSAGALAGTLAALDRLDDLERFLLDLRPEGTFRPNRLWQLPLLGTHDYALPETVAEWFGDLEAVARDLTRCERELVVCATDVTDTSGSAMPEDYELVYSSRSTPPAELAQAILASAAISALVLPMRVGDRIATDGAWARNFPLAHAYSRPEVQLIACFRYIPRYPPVETASLAKLRRRLERFGRVPPIRGFIAELREAEERQARGEPPHMVDMIRRVMRVTVLRNTVLEERFADEKDDSIRELNRLREDAAEIVRRNVSDPLERERAVRALQARFLDARFPFGGDRLVPRITVRASVSEVSLEPGFRNQKPWTEEAKRSLIARGYELTTRELNAAGVGDELAALGGDLAAG